MLVESRNQFITAWVGQHRCSFGLYWVPWVASYIPINPLLAIMYYARTHLLEVHAECSSVKCHLARCSW